MALTAKFLADFSSFTDAVNKAEVQLKGFEGNANKVGASLNRMVDNFSGRKLIQEATLMSTAVEKIGGPSKLTAHELQNVANRAGEAAAKMRALGIEVPPKIQALANQVQPLPGAFGKVTSAVTAVGGALGIAFTGVAILNGIKNQIAAALNYADTLALLRAKTQLGYRDLQILEDVGTSTGVSIEALANSVQVLQMRLGDGTARKGIQALGLSFDAILRMSPAEQFSAIGAAIAKIEDPTERAKAAAAVFGRTWKEIIPALRSNMAEVAKGVKAVEDAHIDAADVMGDRWDQFWLNQKRGWLGWAGNVLLNWEKVSKKSEELQKKMAGAVSLPGAPGARIANGPFVNNVSPEMISQLRVYGKTLDETAKASERVAAAEKRGAQAREDFLEISKAGLGPLYNWQAQLLLTKFKLDQLTVSETTLAEELGDLTDFISSHKGEMFPEPPPGSLEAWKKGEQAILKVGETVPKAKGSLDNLAEAFAQLGQIAGGTLGELARDIGTVIAAMKLGEQAGKDMRDGFKQGGADGYAKMAAGALAAAAAIDAATNSMSKTKNVLGGMAVGWKTGAAAAGIFGAAIGAVAGALVGLVKSNTLEARTVSPLRDEFFKMAGGLEKLNPEVLRLSGNLRLVQAVFDARNIEQYNAAIRELQGLFEFHTAAMATLDETAKKYNLTIEEMGPAWQRQELDKKAQELFKDYEILTSAGVDHVVVLGKMAESVNKYVQNAVKMGVEVPQAMKPMLEDMVKQGLLTDAAGNKITNLEEAGISFAMTMSEGFKSLIAEVQKLTDAIARGLGLAIKNIPDAEIDIYGKYHPPKNLPRDDGFNDNIIGMAAGGRGRVTKPTLFLAGEGGAEDVAFSGANKRFGGGEVIDMAEFRAMKEELAGLRREASNRDRLLPQKLVAAFKDAMAH